MLTPFPNMETFLGSGPPPFLDVDTVILAWPSQQHRAPLPRWRTSPFCTWRRALRRPPPPRWKAGGGGVRGTGRLPSRPSPGPLAPAGGIKAGRRLASLSLGWLPGSVPGETEWAGGGRLPNQPEARRSSERRPSNWVACDPGGRRARPPRAEDRRLVQGKPFPSEGPSGSPLAVALQPLGK